MMLRALAAGVLLALAGAAPATAAPVQLLPDVGRVRALPGGLYEVLLRTGAPLTTHGADGPPASDGHMEVVPRPPRCAASSEVRVLYGRPALSFDGLDAAAPRIQEAMWRLNGALDQAALESGGRHADLRVRCDADGYVGIDSFVNPLTPSFADVVDAARLAGATDADADYVIFYADDSPDACGVGSFSDDDRASAANANNEGGGYAVVYSDCWDESTALHEIAHTQGAVQPGSPAATGQGHCRDELDVMCYADGSEGAAGMLAVCDRQRFDCGYDDYFDVAPEPGEYLETHWNLGSPLNRFIELSDLLPGEDAALLGGCAILPLWIEPQTCDAGEDDRGPQPSLRIRSIARVRGGQVRIGLHCPAARTGDCRGRLRLRSHGRTVGRSRAFRVAPDSDRAIRVRLATAAARAASTRRLRRLRVIAEDAATPRPARRTVALRSA